MLLPILENMLLIIIVCIFDGLCLLVVIYDARQFKEYPSPLDTIFFNNCTIEEFKILRRTKPSFQTICEVYEKIFGIFNRKINKVTKIFKATTSDNLPLNSYQILKIKLEIKIDDKEIEQPYQEHLQKMNQQLPEPYQKES